MTYINCPKFTEDQGKLDALIKQAIEKVAEANAKVAAGILPTESVAESAGLSEPSLQKETKSSLLLPPP